MGFRFFGLAKKMWFAAFVTLAFSAQASNLSQFFGGGSGGSSSTPFTTLSYAATINVNASGTNAFEIHLTGDATIANPTNLTSGQTYTFKITQDNGTRSITWGTNYVLSKTYSGLGESGGLFTFVSDGTKMFNATAVAHGCAHGKKIFNYTGSNQTFTMPQGACTLITAKVWGAGGGGVSAPQGSSPGGGGGFVSATWTLSTGSSITVLVGQGGIAGAPSGCTGSAATFGGGGPGGNCTNGGPGASGGGRSAIISSGTEVLTAGGGGGANSYSTYSPTGAGAGGGGSPTTAYCGGANGTGASVSAGGAGGNNCYGSVGAAGTQFNGGAGGASTWYAGAGGGGGYYGGGGGGGIGGGGGGSNYNSFSVGGNLAGNGAAVANSIDAVYAEYSQGSVGAGGLAGTNGGHGLVVISY